MRLQLILFSRLGILYIIKIRTAMFGIGPLKPPGEDGFPSLFYQQNWEAIKKQVVGCIYSMWRDPSLIQELNSTYLSLLPRSQSPNS